MATARRLRKMTRSGIAIVAILAALLSTHAVGLANSGDFAQVEDRAVSASEIPPLYEIGVVNGTPHSSDDSQVLIAIAGEPAAAKPGVSVWGKCQTPGKCEVGIKITIRF